MINKYSFLFLTPHLFLSHNLFSKRNCLWPWYVPLSPKHHICSYHLVYYVFSFTHCVISHFLLLCKRYVNVFFSGFILLSSQPNEPVSSVFITFRHSFSLYIIVDSVSIWLSFYLLSVFIRQHMPLSYFYFTDKPLRSLSILWSFYSFFIFVLSYRTVYIKQYIGNTPFFIVS